jgi:L-ribulose-5-phosphate 4-epimerase
MTSEETKGDYEFETGRVIVEAFIGLDPMSVPAALVRSHGPFCWGRDARHAVENAAVLEEVAMMAWHARAIDPSLPPMRRELLDRHYLRKHGTSSYSGQK